MPQNYSKDLDTLLALVTHLAMSQHVQRTPKYLAIDLSIDEPSLLRVLNEYQGLFRKSRRTAKSNGSHFYALQIRYARQWIDQEADDSEGAPKEPLDSAYLTTLLDFVTHRANEEENRFSNAKAAILAGVVSLLVAVIALNFGAECCCVAG